MLAGFVSETDTARYGVEDKARLCLTFREIFDANFGRLFELQSEHFVFMHELDRWWELYCIYLDMNLLNGSEICMPSNGL